MLPLQQAREVRDSIIEYIKATFKFKEKDVSDAFYRFIESKEDGLFKGPYISLKTPFVSASEEENKNIPLEIAPSLHTCISCRRSVSSLCRTVMPLSQRSSLRVLALVRQSVFFTQSLTIATTATSSVVRLE